MNNFDLKKLTNGTIVLDFKNCKTLGEIHLLLKEKFGFHDFYGENWDALWDLLCDAFFKKEIRLELYNFNTLNPEILTECALMLEVFDDLKEKYQAFDYKIVS